MNYMFVMAGLAPASTSAFSQSKTWMPGTRLGKTLSA